MRIRSKQQTFFHQKLPILSCILIYSCFMINEIIIYDVLSKVWCSIYVIFLLSMQKPTITPKISTHICFIQIELLYLSFPLLNNTLYTFSKTFFVILPSCLYSSPVAWKQLSIAAFSVHFPWAPRKISVYCYERKWRTVKLTGLKVNF